jgi:DNA-binding transcriptional LysR family regulator
LHLEATNRPVDVIGERIDVAIRVRVPPLEDSGLVMRVLTERAWCMVASPRLVPDGAAPKSPADLAQLPTLDIGPALPSHAWKLEGPNGATAEVRHVPRLVTDDMLTLRQAAIAGVGVVPLPSMLVSDQIRQGQLVQLVPEWQPRGGIVHAVYPTRRGLLPSVRALIDYLAARFSEIDET